ncbi:glutamine amidotransferase [Kitasatospora sp. MMS16-BH015]|uniref:type 1 glutamine amidotransferase domain-containing protein n=1 Tax=Kitasatospora sp. MMS16-BH015 TaxID=2018025 RepID=UPI000CA3675C|nr:type 1 glutamine amidotransferase domain-containing protein [Kitasatospora sp. MMS16-BH015]AUG81666.1 glutamine amidotransferase [Kitasatospora sp. MMS16-BH015]
MDLTHEGIRALAITADHGVEQDELLVPVRHLRQSGAWVDLATTGLTEVGTTVRDKEPGVSVEPTHTLDQVGPDGYDLLLIPGGTLNADSLRTEPEAVELLRAFVAGGRTVAAICHGPWLLVEADVVRGKRLTSFPSLRTDLTNAGAHWTDQELVDDDHGGWRLLTSRSPDDLDAFLHGIDTALAAA